MELLLKGMFVLAVGAVYGIWQMYRRRRATEAFIYRRVAQD
jgi:hypothetical protein